MVRPTRLLTLGILFLSLATAIPALAEEGKSASSPGLDHAVALQETFASIAERVFPSVVSIIVYRRVESRTGTPTPASAKPRSDWVRSAEGGFEGFERVAGATGIVMSASGDILACRHPFVLDDGSLAPVIEVETDDGKKTLSRIVATEPTLNLALIRFEVLPDGGLPKFTRAKIGDSTKMKIGHWAIAVGDPVGPERDFQPGILTGRPSRDCYQEQRSATLLHANVRVHPESFGGPLVNIHGEVVGILTPLHGLGGEKGTARSYGPEYALPMKIVTGLYETMKRTRSRRSPWLGFAVMSEAELRSERSADEFRALKRPPFGIYLENIFDPSPAQTAGLRIGDFLTHFDGRPIRSPVEFQKWLYLSGIGRRVKLEIFRDGEAITVELPIEERPAKAAPR